MFGAHVERLNAWGWGHQGKPILLGERQLGEYVKYIKMCFPSKRAARYQRLFFYRKRTAHLFRRG